MRFALSAERRQFAESLHDLLAATDVAAAGRGWAAGDHSAGLAIWRRLGELGATGLAVPERWGGLAAHPIDVVIACEELGHHAVPGPVAETVAAVPTLLGAVADVETAQRWLPGLADGALVATIAVPPRLPRAVNADAAGLTLLLVDDTLRLGVPGAGYPSMDPTRRLFDLDAGSMLATGPAVTRTRTRALELGTLACAGQLLGAGRAVLELAVDYAKQRVQFGRSIGAFQAVKHQLADVAIALEFARPLLYGAAVALADDSPTVARDTSAAKVACTDAAHRAARTALQVHGAIGYTLEYGLDRWLTKIRALVPAWGTQSEHRARVLAALVEEPVWS